MPIPVAIAGPLIGGAASLIGGLIAKKGAADQNTAQAIQAQKQMDFQERMSNTAHQREIKDLRLAGLNPILSGTGGRGASSPPGAQATQVNELAPALHSAQQVARTILELQNIRQQNSLLKAQTDRTRNQANIISPQAEVMADLTEGYSSAKQVSRKIGSGLGGAAYRLKSNPADSLRNVIDFITSLQTGTMPLRIDDSNRARTPEWRSN